jgi:hypothetical protein
MLARRHPFKSPSNQQLETLRNICALPPALGRDLTHPAQSIILHLLAKDPDARLCGLGAVKADPFFEGLDWDAVYHRRVPAPYVPSLRSREDTACFPQYYTDERVPYSEVLALNAGPQEEESGGVGGGRQRRWRASVAGVECLFPGFSFLGCRAWGAAGGRKDEEEGDEGGWDGGATDLQQQQQKQQQKQQQRALLAALPDEEEACFAGFDFCAPIEEEGEGNPVVQQQQQE